MEIHDEPERPDENACPIVYAPLSQLQAAIEEKLKEGFPPFGPPFGTDATVNIEGQEVAEMA